MSIFKTDLHNKISDEWLIDLNLMVCYTEREILKKNDDDDDDAAPSSHKAASLNATPSGVQNGSEWRDA
jgi:hypothetical protein